MFGRVAWQRKHLRPFGSILWHAAGKRDIFLETADGITFKVGRNSFTRFGLLLLGLPHIGLRLRARALLATIIKRDSGIDGKRLLDLGCGIGIYSLELSHRRVRTIGIDVNHERVRAADRMARDMGLSCRFLVADAERLPLRESSFDSVLCSEVLEHVQNDSSALKEMSRVLKPFGTLHLSTTADSALTREIEEHMDHARCGYTKDKIVSLLTNCGLCPNKVSPYGLRFGSFSWYANRRMFSSKLLLGITFYPLFFLTYLDLLTARLSPQMNKRIIGWIVCSRKVKIV
jgi:SAM-dependent methyltransferase